MEQDHFHRKFKRVAGPYFLKLKLFFFVFCLGVFSLAQEGRFGPEWTFIAREIVENSSESRLSETKFSLLQKRWIEAIKKECPSCIIKHHEPIYLLSFIIKRHNIYLDQTQQLKQRPFFSIDTDPLVFEVNAPPHSIKEFEKNKHLFQKLVFDTAKKVGLEPHYRIGGGHIHLDKKTHFKGNDLLLRNFIVDTMNHPELFMGALSHDYLNASPLAILHRTSRENFIKILKEYDKDRNIENFLTKINYDVYNNIHGINREFSKRNDSIKVRDSKHQVLNFLHEDTIEFRGFQPQKSAEHYLSMLKLLEGRLHYLSQFDTPIAYEQKDYERDFNVKVSGMYSSKIHNYETRVPVGKILNIYRKYVEESDLNWDDYKHYLADKRLKQGVNDTESVYKYNKFRFKTLEGALPSRASCFHLFQN